MILIPMILLTAAALWLARFLVRRDRGAHEPVRALWAVFGLGFVGMIAASVLEVLIPADYLPSATGALPAPSMGLFLAAMAVGLIEELCKIVPAALFVYKKPYFNEHTDGIIYFAIAGLGFGLPENLLYVLQFGTSAGFMRLLLTPFFHAALTALIGYFLVRVKLDRASKWTVVVAYLGVASLHGLYDFGLFTGIIWLVMVSLLISVGLTVALFVAYARSTRSDQLLGLSAVGNNSFCRNCGTPNPKHYLYCQHCGKHA